MSKISDFASNSIMGVVRKIVNHLVDNVDPQISDATDHLPARFSGSFNDSTRNLTMTIESQGASAENLVATVNIPAGGGGSGGSTYSAGNGINITSENAIEIDTNVAATKQSVDTLQAQVGDAFTAVAIGADGKSLDFTALDGQVNNIELPSSGGGRTVTTLATVADLITAIKSGSVGDEFGFSLCNYTNTIDYKFCHFTIQSNNGSSVMLSMTGLYINSNQNPQLAGNFCGASIIDNRIFLSLYFNKVSDNRLFYSTFQIMGSVPITDGYAITYH